MIFKTPIVITGLIGLLGLSACASKTPPPKPVRRRVVVRAIHPPKTLRQNIRETLHGVEVADPYRWLEDIKSPKVRRWLAGYDRFTRDRLGKLPHRDRIKKRLEQLSYVDSVSVPVHRGDRYFYRRRHADKEKEIYYWRAGLKGEEHVLLDPNQLSKNGSIAVKGVYVAYNGKTAAYKLSKNNADTSTLYVMDVDSGKTSDIDVIEGAKYASPSWTPDATGFYYTRLPTDKSIPVDKLPGHAAVYFHKLGTDPKKDPLVHQKLGDPRKFIGPHLSRDGKFLFVTVYHGWTKTDVYVKQLRRDKKFRPLVVGLDANFHATAWRGKIYVHTNHQAPRYQVFQVKPRRLARKRWKRIVPEHKAAVLRDFAIVGNHLALNYLRNASSELQLAKLNGKLVRKIDLPGVGTSSNLVGNPDEDEVFFQFSSYNYPKTIFKASVKGKEVAPYFKLNVPLDPSRYAVEQVHYPSKDGTKISMFIVRSKKFVKDGSTPFILYGYGGFNISLTPRFRPGWFVWLEMGGAWAIPNLRGGGEYGEAWHRAGMLHNKQNVFDDYIAAAEYLIKNKYTSKKKLAIRGGSNGGLLVGAAMTQRPDLYQAVLCHVPLLDMVRYHKFGSGRTWISEYGSAEDPAQFKTLHAYSPYHRVKPKTAYPALLMLAADSDDRVDPMHARKFVAAIAAAQSTKNPVWLRVETNAGHGGGDMVKKRVALFTDELAFVLKQLAVKPKL